MLFAATTKSMSAPSSVWHKTLTLARTGLVDGYYGTADMFESFPAQNSKGFGLPSGPEGRMPRHQDLHNSKAFSLLGTTLRHLINAASHPTRVFRQTW